MKIFPLLPAVVLLCAGGVPLGAQTHPDLGSLADYPVDSKVWLGSIVGEVLVDPEIEIEVAKPGEFNWRVAEGDTVEENDVLGTSGATKIDLSERQLALQRNRHRHSLLDLEWATEEKRRALRVGIRELEDRLTKLELTGTERELLGDNFAERLLLERKEIEAELERSREKLGSDYFDEMLRLDRQTLDLDLERAEEDHRELIRTSEQLASASGVVRIDSREPVRSPTVMGRIIRKGIAEVTVELLDPRLRSTPGAELEVEVRGDDQLNYRGTFLREMQERSFNSNARLVVFEIAAREDQDAVPASLAGSRMVRVSRVLPEPGHQIPKDDLVFKFPKEITEIGWTEFIRKRWPDVRIIHIASRVVVVAPTK